MARITVLGGNGYVGAAVVAEARKRGHDVTAVSRTAPSSPVAGADYVEGSVLDADVLERTTAGRDVVLVALSPRGDMAGKVEGVVEELIARLAGTSTRLGYVGGASSLLAEEGGPRLWDVTKDHVPDEVKPEVQTGLDTFALCQESPDVARLVLRQPACGLRLVARHGVEGCLRPRRRRAAARRRRCVDDLGRRPRAGDPRRDRDADASPGPVHRDQLTCSQAGLRGRPPAASRAAGRPPR